MNQISSQFEKGHSLVELVIVLSVVSILSLLALMSFGSERIFKADQQSYELADVLQEARQRALSQRKTMRVEINESQKEIRLINEQSSSSAADDVVVRTLRYQENGVFIGNKPTNLTGAPSELAPIPDISFGTSIYPTSSGNKVATLRFLRNGRVTDAGIDAIGSGAITSGDTIFVWSKHINDTSGNPTDGQVFRAITVMGSSGLTRIWKCPLVNGACSDWSVQ